jgi:hypothetical protein
MHNGAVQLIFTEFKKVYNSEQLNIPIKLVRGIETCLNDTYIGTSKKQIFIDASPI